MKIKLINKILFLIYFFRKLINKTIITVINIKGNEINNKR